MSAVVYTKSNPAMFDNLMADIQQALADGLPWLDRAYGKAERLRIVLPSGKKGLRPVWSKNGNDYDLLLPDDRAGGFSFFLLEDPVNVDEGHIRADVHLIIWGDMRRVTSGERNTELARAQVLDALRGVSSRAGHFDTWTVSEGVENVFRGLLIEEIDNRCLTQPWFGFRISGRMEIVELC